MQYILANQTLIWQWIPMAVTRMQIFEIDLSVAWWFKSGQKSQEVIVIPSLSKDVSYIDWSKCKSSHMFAPVVEETMMQDDYVFFRHMEM